MSESEGVRRFDADFKKTPGTLSLTATHIAWVPTSPNAMDRQNQAMNRAIKMLASKAGSERVSLKILFKDDRPAGGLLFVFTNPATREEDRKAVQDHLIPFVSANVSGPTLAAPSSPAMASPAAPAAPSPSSSVPGTPGAVANGSALKGKRKADEMSDGGGASGLKVDKAANSIRQRVLRKNPNLAMLYRELVLSKQITADEFWEGREGLLHAEEMARAQRPGRQSRLLDDRFELDSGKGKQNVQGGTGVGIKKQESGPVVLNISKDLTREIFEEFPVVQDAYAKHVPGISEVEFWSRYFQSRLWERHRASTRKTSTEDGTARKDDIFDQYLEEPDWDEAPRNQPDQDVERFLDLRATEEDHGESSTQRDITMQAGRQKESLPLMRRFNEHSMRLLKRTGGETGTSLSNTAIPDNYDIYNEIDLEDLRGPAQATTFELDVGDADQADGDKEERADRGIILGRSAEELQAYAIQGAERIRNWRIDLNSVSIPTPPGGWEKDRADHHGSAEQARRYEKHQEQKDSGTAAMLVVKDMLVAYNAENASKTPFAENLFEQMRSCHNAANEFLRQYWSAVLPTFTGPAGTSTGVAAKVAKAAKMIEYLRKTEPKVEAIVQAGIIAGEDPARIRAALAPTVGAVNVALRRQDRLLANGTT